MGASVKRLRKRVGRAGRNQGQEQPQQRVRARRGVVAATEEEHLAQALARVRARFGVDPAAARASLASAWQEPLANGIEEDEAELVDAVADCLGAGFTLDEALSCWDGGQLVDDRADDAPDELPEARLAIEAAAHNAGGRRVLVR
jgi:hypothetical protein